MKLEDVFEHTHRLPTVPKVVQELIASFNNPNIDLDNIASRIAMDQVIAAKTLRLANSAHFATTRRIGSLNEATMVLGFSTLRTLVVATGITGAFVNTPGFDRKRFWKNSLAVAGYARCIARLSQQDSDGAFTCGLIHNIGELLIHVVAPELAVHIDRSVEKGADRKILEDNNIGFDYIMVGAELAKRWSFPDAFQLAILYQNEPLRHPEAGKLGVVLHLALQIAKLLNAQKNLTEIAEQLPEAELTALGLRREQIATQLEQAQADIASMGEMIA